MKGFYFLFILLIVGISLHAQNYAPVYANRSIHYFGDTSIYSYWNSPNIISLKSDSFQIQFQDTIIFPFHSEPDMGFGYLCRPPGIPPQGQRIIKQSHQTVILNKNGDSIFFRLNPQINEEWVFHQLLNGSLIKAKVISKGVTQIGNSQDSILNLELILHDSLQNRLNSSANDTLRLSKHHGLLDFKNWKNYPDTLIRSHLFRINTSIPSRREIFDFSIGDTFHYRSPQLNAAPIYTWITILNKWHSSGMDIVYYQRRKSYGQPIDTVFYQNLSQPIFDVVYQEVKSNVYLKNFAIRNSSSSRRILMADVSIYYDTLNNCYESHNWDELGFGEGLGRTWKYTRDPGFSNFTEEELIYYRKGNERWGTPYNFVVGQKELLGFQDPISIFPNPSKNTIQISGLETNSEIRIYNLGGQLILNERISPNQLIDISSLRDGLHIVEIRNKKGLFRKKFVKK